MLKAFVAFNVFWYLSNLYQYSFLMGLLPIKPVHSYFFTLVVGAVLLIAYRKPLMPSGRGKVLTIWACTLLLYYQFSFLFVSDGGPEAVQALITSSEALVLLLIFVLLFQDSGIHRVATYAVVAVVIVDVIMNYFDFFTRGSIIPLSLIPGRAAGMYIDANNSGFCLVFGMILSTWILPRKLRWAYCMIVGSAVVLTFSRSSIMLWALGILLMSWYSWFVASRRVSFAITAAALLIAGGALTSGLLADYAKESGAAQYLDTNTLQRIATSFLAQDDESTRDRVRVAQRGLEAFGQAPVFGQGIGALNTSRFLTEPHNEYIIIAAELGVVGLLVFLGLLALLWLEATAVSRMIALTYGFGCLFLHQLLLMPVMPVVITIAALYPVLLARRTRPEAGEVSFA